MIKKIIAKEIVFVFIASFFCIILFGVGSFLENNQKKNIKNYSIQFESIKNQNRKQFLWYLLKTENLYSKSYQEFIKDYKNSEDQYDLYFLTLKYNFKEFRWFDEFRELYFKKEKYFDEAFRIYYDQGYEWKEEYLLNNYKHKVLVPKHDFGNFISKKDWLKFARSKYDFYKILRNNNTLKQIHNKLIERGYKITFDELNILLFSSNNIKIVDKEYIIKMNFLKEKISNNNTNYKIFFNKLILLVIILFFPFRYLALVLKWSLKVLKE